MSDRITRIKQRWAELASALITRPIGVEDYLQLLGEAGQLTRERDEARAEVQRQARHIEELQQKIDAEKSCACSYDAPGDVCVAHSPALSAALGEVEELRARAELAQRFRQEAEGRMHVAWAKQRAENERLKQERDEARAENERLRVTYASQGYQPSVGPGKPPINTPNQGSSGRKWKDF